MRRISVPTEKEKRQGKEKEEEKEFIIKTYFSFIKNINKKLI